MVLNECPHCKKPAMTTVQKLLRGSRKSYECNSCGKRVGISKWARLVGVLCIVSLPFFGGLLGNYIIEDAPNFAAAFGLSFALFTLLQSLVPIIAKEPVE